MKLKYLGFLPTFITLGVFIYLAIKTQGFIDFIEIVGGFIGTVGLIIIVIGGFFWALS